MKIRTGAATAAGFALLLNVSLNCLDASAQAAAATFQQPTVAAASMTEAPQAPTLQGASCGTIGPQGSDATFIVGVNTASVTVTDVSMLQVVSNGINQFKGKVAQKTIDFLESLQRNSHKTSVLVVPSGYTITRTTSPVPPVVF